MKVFRATSGEWQSGQTHYLIAAESSEQAYQLAQEESMSYVDYDTVYEVDFVSTTLTRPAIIEEL